jgi:hypothetical protein
VRLKMSGLLESGCGHSGRPLVQTERTPVTVCDGGSDLVAGAEFGLWRTDPCSARTSLDDGIVLDQRS